MPPPSLGCLLSLLLPLGWPRGWGEPEEEQKWGSEHLFPGSTLPSCFYCSPAPPPRSDRTQRQSLQGPCSQASEHTLFLLGAQQSSDREEAGSWASHGGEEAARQKQNHRTRRPRGRWRVCRALGAAGLCFTAPQEGKWGSGPSIRLFSHLRFGAITHSLQCDHLLLLPNCISGGRGAFGGEAVRGEKLRRRHGPGTP